VIEARGCSGRTRFGQPPVLVAPDRGKAALHQQIGRSPRLERAAEMISETDDLRDAERGNIRKHGFKREAVAMNIGDRGKFHRPAS
jgi:hypothetical protein